MRISAIIPARLSSTRLYQKLLIEVDGKSILQYVFENVKKSNLFDEIIIATDSEVIVQHVRGFGATVQLTKDSHKSGTDRVAEVAQKLDSDIILNIQGDEPLLQHDHLRTLVELIKKEDVPIATLCTRFKSLEFISDPSNVKVTKNLQNQALYFSRHAIPFNRDCEIDVTNYFHHIGIYGFKREALLKVAKLPMGKLEQIEKLEQLRWMENGIPIYLAEVDSTAISIDTERDLALFKAHLQKRTIK